MAITITEETGVGLAGANSYVSEAYCTDYHVGHVNGMTWAGGNAVMKQAALIMATRILDAEVQFYGRKVTVVQALQWPRFSCPDVDRAAERVYYPATEVPKCVKQATCELARELLVLDRTLTPPGEGIYFNRNSDGSQIIYSKTDVRQILTRLCEAYLLKVGRMIRGGGGAVTLVRT